MDFEEKFDERCEKKNSKLGLETKNENHNISIQEKYHPLHSTLEGNFDLSCAQCKCVEPAQNRSS
jgi:hypothetical protein